MTEFDATRLADFVAWSRAWEPPLTELDFVAAHVSITSATLFTQIMFPDLLCVRGCLIVRRHYKPEFFEQWWEQSGGNLREVERNVNRMYLWHHFEPEGPEQEAAVAYLASKIALSWRLQATLAFPDIEWETCVEEVYGPVVVLARAG